jgi:putative N6-adenine-specific DNA methylase
VTAPGLAPLCAAELEALGITGARGDEAGVAFDATPEALWRANLWLRTASRVLSCGSPSSRRAASPRLEEQRHACAGTWSPRDCRRAAAARDLSQVALSTRMPLAERVARAVAAGAAARGPAGARPARRNEGDDAGPLFVVRFAHDRCTISADASGALLHQRGYRQAVGKAPLRETLAAAMLLAAGYDGSGPLVDPLCGSGTIAVEAALIARRLAPGRHRRFAFERWPSFDAGRWRRLLAEADAAALPAAPAPILASDRDAGAIEATLANAARAGVAGDLTVVRQALSDVVPPEGAGRRVAGHQPAVRQAGGRGRGAARAVGAPGAGGGAAAPRLAGGRARARGAARCRPRRRARRTARSGAPHVERRAAGARAHRAGARRGGARAAGAHGAAARRAGALPSASRSGAAGWWHRSCRAR